jgi:hypothetical protein
VLRLHPIVPNIMRQAGREDVIPLAEPLTTTDGTVVSAIPVSEGLEINVSIAMYNR